MTNKRKTTQKAGAAAQRRDDAKKIGKLLIESGYINSDQLAHSIKEQARTKKRLGETIVSLGYVTEDQIALMLSMQLGIPYTDFETAVVEPMAIELVPERLAEKYTVLPLSIDRGVLTIVMSDPLNFEALSDLGFVSDRNVIPTVSTATEIKRAIRRHYHLAEPVDEIVEKISSGFIEVLSEKLDVTPHPEDVERAIKKGESPPIVRMLNSIIYKAVRNRASDVHIEPRSKIVVVRERVDGLLNEVLQLPKWVQGALTSRIKVLARLDIAEKKIPQDGRLKIRVDEREVDLRISILPIQYGESVVIRILDTSSAVLKLDDLGFSPRNITRTRSIIEKPQGLVLVTGPTGSGKSSTLYAMINSIKSDRINIISLEEPIEYELSGVKQVAVNEKTGLTFAFGLRSVLRQDPDVILVGEMRDFETSNIAIQSSLTGHLVLSTLHTNTAVAAVTRIKNMGVQPYLLASSLNGIIAQRLVRRLCPKCKLTYRPSDEDLIKLGLKRDLASKITFYKGGGCANCKDTGYRGRVAICEVLVCNSMIREMISSNATEEAILKAAVNNGMRYITEDGIEKGKQGITSIEELLRVLYVEEEEKVNVCPNCSEYIRNDFLTCPFCGYSIVQRCPECGITREPGWKYCPYCRK